MYIVLIINCDFFLNIWPFSGTGNAPLISGNMGQVTFSINPTLGNKIIRLKTATTATKRILRSAQLGALLALKNNKTENDWYSGCCIILIA